MNSLAKELDLITENTDGLHLLLHSCCAPCSSYVLEYLGQYFSISILFYNPNIVSKEEYSLRLNEQKNILKYTSTKYPVVLLEKEHDPSIFLESVKGLENEPEGGKRCTTCYELRLREAALTAVELKADYFTTTLSISPHKDSQLLDSIALSLQEELGVKRLPSDFKKKGGFQRSIELSKKYNLYRQNWCGCPFSKLASEKQYNLKEN